MCSVRRQPDSFGAKIARDLRVVGSIGIRTHAQFAHRVRPRQKFFEVRRHLGIDRRHPPLDHFARRSVERDVLAAAHHRAIRRQRARAVIDLQRRHSRHARLAHPARDHRRMTRHPAARREDSFRHLHPLDIFRRRLDAHQNHFAPCFRDRDRFVRREHHFAVDRTRRRRQSARDHVLLARRIQPRMQKLLELFRLDALQRGLAIDQLLVGHIDRDSHRRLRRPLAGARLQHEQAISLDRKFHVLRIAKMLFQLRRDFQELFENVGEAFFERRVMRRALSFADPRALGPFTPRLHADLPPRADSRDHVLALRVGQKLAVDSLLAGARIARERDAGRAIVAEISEHHRLHRHRGAPVAGDIVDAPIRDRAIVMPRVEHRAHCHPQLLARVLRDVAADARSNQRAELADQFPQIIDVQIGIVLDPARRFFVFDNLLERIGIVLVLRLQLEHDVAEHLAEPPVRVPRKPRIAADLFEALHRLVGEPEVQHRVHHPRHRHARARSHRHQQRILRVAEFASERLLDPRNALRDAVSQPLRIFVSVIVKVVADLRRDRKSRRHRQLEPRHLGEVRALAPQQIAHLGASFRHARTEKVDLRMNATHVNPLLPSPHRKIVRRKFQNC